MIAKHRPSLYANAAAEVLVALHPRRRGRRHRAATAATPTAICSTGSCTGQQARRSRRADARSALSGASKPPRRAGNVREEAFPALWDRRAARVRAPPRGGQLIRSCTSGRWRPSGAVIPASCIRRRTPGASAMLAAPYPPTVELALAELRRRFDPRSPDWDLLGALVGDVRPARAGRWAWSGWPRRRRRGRAIRRASCRFSRSRTATRGARRRRAARHRSAPHRGRRHAPSARRGDLRGAPHAREERGRLRRSCHACPRARQ